MIESLLGALLVVALLGVHELRRIRRAILRGNLERKIEHHIPRRAA